MPPKLAKRQPPKRKASEITSDAAGSAESLPVEPARASKRLKEKKTVTKASPDIIAKAQAMAKALEEEFAYPFECGKSERTRMIKHLHDEVPSRGDLVFQKSDGKSTPKLALQRDASAARDKLASKGKGKGKANPLDVRQAEPPAEGSPEYKQLMSYVFCILHLEFVKDAGVDIDHLLACVSFRERQEDFLTFLNEVGNKVLANVFLDIESVKPYFRRDKDGVIKASSLFYNTCYSNIYNLWLLCHACNREKSASEQLAFFAEADNFGAPFISAVSAAGGLHRGLFFDRIYPLTGGEINEVVGSDLVTFPTDKSQGLVEFALNWFFKKYGDGFVAMQRILEESYLPMKASADQIFKHLRLSQQAEARKICRKMAKELTVASAVKKVFSGKEGSRGVSDSSSSSSDDSSDAKRRFASFEIAVLGLQKRLHHFNKMARFLEERFGKEFKETVTKSLCADLPLSEASWQRIRELVKKAYADESLKIPAKDVCQRITKWMEELTPRRRLIMLEDENDSLRAIIEKKDKIIAELQSKLIKYKAASGERADDVADLGSDDTLAISAKSLKTTGLLADTKSKRGAEDNPAGPATQKDSDRGKRRKVASDAPPPGK